MTTADPVIRTTTRRFDHQRGGDWPGMRGVVIDASRHSDSTRVFTPEFPAVWLTDNGEVDLDEYRWLASEFLAWLDAVRPLVAEAVERREPYTVGIPGSKVPTSADDGPGC